VYGKSVLVLVCGYRNDYEEVLDSYQQVGERATAAGIEYDVVVCYFWRRSWAYIGFPLARARANHDGEILGELLGLMSRTAVVDLESHSLGARVCSRALLLGARIRLFILTAPAIADNAFGAGAEFAAVPRTCQAVHVCYSRRDWALKAYRLFAWMRAAMGLSGPKAPVPENVHAHDYTAEVAGHGDHKRNARMYQNWKEWAG
jgi:esterase/lipase superfamily enzyme